MLGRSHVASAWCAGLAVAPLLGMHTAAAAIPFAAVAAGCGAVPDWDHPGSGASRLFGPVTGLLSRATRFVSARVYQATKGPRDEDWSGKHRHMTHTAIWAALLGGLTAWGTAAGGHWAVAAVVALGLLLAVDCLGDGAVADFVLFAALAAGVLWWTSVGTLGVLDGMTGWIGWAVFVGCIAHDLGDACTVSGVPILTPLPIAGEVWYEVRLLGPLSIRTGHWVERRVFFPAFVAAGVLLVPGVGSLLWPLIGKAAGQIAW